MKGVFEKRNIETYYKPTKQTYVLVFPTYFNRSSILHWTCIFPQFFPHISKYSLYHVAIAASPNPRPLFSCPTFCRCRKDGGTRIWPNRISLTQSFFKYLILYFFKYQILYFIPPGLNFGPQLQLTVTVLFTLGLPGHLKKAIRASSTSSSF